MRARANGIWRISHGLGLLALAALLVSAPARAQPLLCDSFDTKPMLVAELFFGRDIGRRGYVSDRAWRRFVRETLGPAVPGFTAIDAIGQYVDAKTHKVGRERTKYVIVALADTPASRDALRRVMDDYAGKFRQGGVGILIDRRCGHF